ncbi:MAG: dihydrofolate reductase [bacterium]|nr:dihydrofolate reductase [bacterium]
MQKPIPRVRQTHRKQTQGKPRVSIVAAIGKNHEIGRGNGLLWHIPDDLKRFKALTLGHPVILGRKTFESIVASLGKPLPGRTNIVITRDPQWRFEGVLVADSLEDALAKAKEIDGEEIFIGGGANVWSQSLTYVDRLYLTLIDDGKDADTFFPPYETVFTKKLSEEKREWNGLHYTWLDLEKEL